MHPLLAKALEGNRLSPTEALQILRQGDWTETIQVANALRHKKHPNNKVGYTVFRIINYTNVCTVRCSFCSFCRHDNDKEAYVLSLEEIRKKTQEAKKIGAHQIFLQGGVHPGLSLNYYTDILKMLTKEEKVSVRGFSPVELKRMSENFQIPLRELLKILKESGLSSVPGAGAEILSSRMRKKLSPRKLSEKEWCDTMEICHEEGLPGSANIVFGSDETPEEIMEHLTHIRNLQDKTGGFKSFVVWTFQPQTKDFPIRHVSGMEYLKLLALSRIFLDNLPHIEVSILGMGRILGEMGLHSGADDINSIVIEENVLQSQGLTSIEEAEDFIRRSGFTPYRRSLNFD